MSAWKPRVSAEEMEGSLRNLPSHNALRATPRGATMSVGFSMCKHFMLFEKPPEY